MNLPNYFIADLPSDARLSASMLTEACQTLRRNRRQYLADRSTDSLIRLLSGVAKDWRDPASPFRKLALEKGPEATGFSEQTIASGLDQFFAQLTRANLLALVTRELGHPERLDKFESTDSELQRNVAGLARGPELLVHVAAGNIPNPTLMSIVLGVLVRSAQFVKCASGASFLPRLFAHSLYEADHKLGSCLEIAEWPGGTRELESVLFNEADCVTATGSDDTLSAIQQQLPHTKRFMGYGHRVSFGYVAREALSLEQATGVIARAGDDIVAWDQLGCLSPHLFYVQAGGAIAPEAFAELLAAELRNRELSHPRGRISTEEAAAISYRRSFYDVRASASAHTRQWRSENSTAWTVIYEADPLFQVSCLNRFVYVKAVTDLEAALRAAEMVRGKVSTVGIAADGAKELEIVNQLAEWGVTRVCPLGKMQQPPLTWRHDGRPALGDLITWTDWEKETPDE